MINDVDEALRRLLIRELPVKNNDIDIAFDQPKREWSARLSRPTLNLFLYTLYENKQLRQTQPIWDIQHRDNRSAIKRRKPIRVNLKYLITAWATEAEDEHRLLSRCLFTLARHPYLPEELLPEGLQNQPVPITMTIGQSEELSTLGDFWGAVDNEWRPGIPCVITLALDPYQPVVEPVVQTGEIRIGETTDARLQQLADNRQPDRFWTVGGMVHTDHPYNDIHLRLIERNLEIPLQPNGQFVLSHLKAGRYTLEIWVKGKNPRRYPVSVPAPDYYITL